jgi:hypothetical protein
MDHKTFISTCNSFGIKKIADKRVISKDTYQVEFEHIAKRNMSKVTLVKINKDGEQTNVCRCYNDEAEKVAYFM